MAEAVMESVTDRGIWYKVRSFFNANLVNIFAGGLFTLLAIFLLYPIISVLLKSLWGDDGFTFDFYVEFFSYNFYYWSLFNTLILGFSTMIILVIVGFCFAVAEKTLKNLCLAPSGGAALYLFHFFDYPLWSQRID
jgi:ABC-type spermidine/putrescine transport system permease subunit I